MEFSWPVILLLLLFVWMILVRIYEFVKGYPPSCIGVPILGRIPMLAVRILITGRKNFLRELVRDSNSKGDVWSCFLGMRRIIGITSYDAVYEALNQDEFAWRPQLKGLVRLRKIDEFKADGKEKKTGGIVLGIDDTWQIQRTFAMTFLHDLPKETMERKIQIEAKHFTTELSKQDGQAFLPRVLLAQCVANVIGQITFGSRTDYDDFDFANFVKCKNIMVHKAKPSVPLFFPFLEGTFITRPMWNKFAVNQDKALNYLKEKVAPVEQNASLESSKPPENYVEAFLRKQQTAGQNSNFTHQQMMYCVMDFFGGSVESVSAYLYWALVYLTLHRDWQTSLQEEIDKELGTKSDISYEDTGRCPKLMAFMDEVHRGASIIPHNISHAVGKECFFRGYRIPTDAVIFTDIYTIHNDPQLWDEPQRFDPSRFLNDSGEHKPSKHLVQFGVGKRFCFGDKITYMLTFNLLASLLKSFDVDVDEKGKALKDKILIGTSGGVHAPLDHKIVFKARSQ